MSLDSQAIRVAQGAKDALKALINKLGGEATNELIDSYAALVDEIDLSTSHDHEISGVKNLQTKLDEKVNTSDVVNNLTSADTTKPLSANQGTVLKDLVDKLRIDVDGKAADEHGHQISEITNLQDTLNQFYTKIEIDNFELVTVDNIDAICGGDNVGTINGIHILSNECSVADDGEGNVVITTKEV